VIVGGIIAITSIAPGTAIAARAADAPQNERASSAARSQDRLPPLPRLPRDFRGRGRYLVPDMDVDVPFTWQGRGGDSVMEAGGKDEKIWFQNLIYDGTLYTITYEWPGVDEVACVPFKGLDRGWLNGKLLKTSRYVGREVLVGTPNRRVHHWRAGLVFLQDLQPKPGQPAFPRIPAMVADIYVGQGNQSRWWKLLQFGVQNQFDPSLDEWLEMDTFSLRPGKVTLPDECKRVQPPPQSLSDILRDLLKDLFGSLQL
jgi:hypothetical protein